MTLTIDDSQLLGEKLFMSLSEEVRLALGAVSIRRLGSTCSTPSVVVSLSPGHGEPKAAIRILDDQLVVVSTPGKPAPTPDCFDRRWVQSLPRGTRQFLEGEDLTETSLAPPMVASHVAGLSALLNIVVDYQRANPPQPCEPLWVWNQTTGELRQHRLMRTMQGSFPNDDPKNARIVLEPVTNKNNSLRRLRVEDLNLPLDALTNPVCGVVGSPGLRGYDAPATAPVSGSFEVRSKWHLHPMWWGGHADSYSKSELLGVLEGLERIAGFRNHKEPAFWGTARDLKDISHVDMSDVGLYSPDFYKRWGDRVVSWADLPNIPWVNGWSLRDDRLVMVPEQIAYYGDHRPNVKVSVQECSNGCASGSTITEAILHGLLELLERDAFLLQWYAGDHPPEIDMDTVQDPVTQNMRHQLDLMGYDLRCFDTRVDIPVPTIGSVAIRRNGEDGFLCFAGGASLDPEQAIRAAVSETASYVPSLARRVKENKKLLDTAINDFSVIEELEHHALLYGRPEVGHLANHWLDRPNPKPLDELYSEWQKIKPQTKELRTPTQWIVDMLAERELNTIVVDQTTDEQKVLGLNTVSVIVPGLIPIDFGWERQRVLEMSRTLWAHFNAGSRTAPLTRSNLRLAPHPFP